MKILRQYDNPDCTLASVMNCVNLNNPNFERIFTQDLLDKYMPDYYNKTPKEAFNFLKERGHDIKFMPLTFAKAKIMLGKGRALVGGLRYTEGWWPDYLDDRIVNGSKDMAIRTKGHAFAIKMVGGKYFIYDSNFNKPYEIDLELFVREKIVRATFYQLR